MAASAASQGEAYRRLAKPLFPEQSEVCFRCENDFLKFPFGTLTCILLKFLLYLYIDIKFFDCVNLPYFMGSLLLQILFYKRWFERGIKGGLRGYKRWFERNKRWFERVDKFINRLLNSIIYSLNSKPSLFLRWLK